MTAERKWSVGVLTMIAGLLLLPILATLVYSFATNWVKTILPASWTLKWYGQLVTNSDFMTATINSLIVGAAAVVVAMVIFLPVIFYINVFDERLKAKVRYLMVMPYAVPGIVLVTGLVQIYGNLPIPKLIFLILIITALSFPAFYQSLDNVFMSRDFRGMFEQARMLGERPASAFVHVILPNVKTGVFVAMLLTFTTGFSEYVITNIFLNGDYETFKIYMYRLMKANGNANSVLTVCYFGLLILVAIILMKLSGKDVKVGK